MGKYLGSSGLTYLWGKIKSSFLMISDAAAVAISGSYNDLSDKPTIPTKLADLSQDSTHRLVTDTEKNTWNDKQATLVSGTTIKTINNESLLGSGNITIQSGGSSASALTNAEIDTIWNNAMT